VLEHLKSYKDFCSVDLKLIKSEKVFKTKEDAKPIVDIEMEKFLSFKDGRDYWTVFNKNMDSNP
jgi:hypothetical protein